MNRQYFNHVKLHPTAYTFIHKYVRAQPGRASILRPAPATETLKNSRSRFNQWENSKKLTDKRQGKVDDMQLNPETNGYYNTWMLCYEISS
jgi:hypothetical protein